MQAVRKAEVADTFRDLERFLANFEAYVGDGRIVSNAEYILIGLAFQLLGKAAGILATVAEGAAREGE